MYSFAAMHTVYEHQLKFTMKRTGMSFTWLRVSTNKINEIKSESKTQDKARLKRLRL